MCLLKCKKHRDVLFNITQEQRRILMFSFIILKKLANYGGVELTKKRKKDNLLCFKYTKLIDAINNGISCLNSSDVNNEILIGSKNVVRVYNLEDNKNSKEFFIENSNSIVGVFKNKNALITGVEDGRVIVQSFNDEENLLIKSINVGSNISCLKQGHLLEKFATGGNENPLKLWDLETGKVEFIAKSPKPDMLQLKQPCYVSDVGFYNNNKIAVAHRHGIVDLHDPLSNQRRPVATCKVVNNGFVSLKTIPDYSDYEVIVGSSKGSIYHYDFRGKSSLPVKTFRGCTGSVRAVDCITSLNKLYVLSISLDCHIRMHNFSIGDITVQDYIVGKPSALLVISDTDS
ncbi:WD repeat-containing protein 74-like [Daktulosphaira vitifoliae]|uniref:WD repeat-containing protein 74-like n=1 Tax=Daktulosphaira vitifoliae TaxID=58002 RepID=UPI0021A9B0B3|nr:WD repeat-containing protein 74-like [Daktulosphaira vitifoliae]